MAFDFEARDLAAQAKALAARITTGTAPGNVPVLDASGKLPVATMPAITVGEVFTVGSQAAMLALTAQIGDVAIRTDLANNRYLLLGSNPATLANWSRVLVPADVVSSIGGLMGDITAGQARTALALDIGSNVQAWDADLDAIAAISGTNKLLFRNGSGVWQSRGLGAGLIDDGTNIVGSSGGSLREQDFTLFDGSTVRNCDYVAVAAQTVTITVYNGSISYKVNSGVGTSFSGAVSLGSSTVYSSSLSLSLGAGVTINMSGPNLYRGGESLIVKIRQTA